MAKSVKELMDFYKDVEREVYLDIENSAPVAPDVLEEMLPYFTTKAYGNPGVTHKLGWEAYEAVMEAAETIAKYIGASSAEEINFTPGDTEANNLALLGVAMASRRDKGKIIISEIEHLSIINVVPLLERMGFEVVKIPVDGEGFIDLDALADAVDSETILVSINMVNHEIGTIEPIKDVVDIVKDKNPKTYVHTDASDAYGKIPIDASSLGIDLMTLSSYKILGPRGIGALYVRDRVRIERIIEGQVGTQRLWPGIENTPLIIGFRKASDLMFKDFDKLRTHLKSLRDRLIKGILDSVDDTILNGPLGDKRAPDNVNISFLRSEGEALTIELSLYGVYASSGSACTRRMLTPSHVMTAIGREYEAAHGSILMKVTRLHTMDDIEYVLEVLPKAVERIRSITPSGGD